MILAVKCAPQKKVFADIKKAGIEAIELYLCRKLLKERKEIKKLCNDFPFRYAIHAPNDCFSPEDLTDLCKSIGAEVVVFHDIYWENEWKEIASVFKDIQAKLCVENIYTVLESVKYMRRYNFGRCLDLEHMQIECAGVYEEAFIVLMKEATHIHLTGYTYGSKLWHTHIHHSPLHSLYLLGLIKKSAYSGYIVSEAENQFQTYDEFKNLNDFYKMWKFKKILK